MLFLFRSLHFMYVTVLGDSRVFARRVHVCAPYVLSFWVKCGIPDVLPSVEAIGLSMYFVQRVLLSSSYQQCSGKSQLVVHGANW